MHPAVAALMHKIDERVLRERALILLSLLAVVFLVWSLFIQAKFDAERVRIQVETGQVETEIKQQEAQAIALSSAMVQDPAIVKKNEINRLSKQVSEIESQLVSLSQGLISAEQLPEVLEEVLRRTTSVKLLQVQTSPAQELRLGTEQSKAQNGAESSSTHMGVYKHEVLIRVIGNYQQLIQLIKEIESLKWKFYWDSLDYTVKNYPNAEIDIRVFTLSSEEGLLGV